MTAEIKICPKCKSKDVGIAAGLLKVPQDGLAIDIDSGSRDECNKCGFRSNFPTLTKSKTKKK
jgi:predicted Zn-ribbon and HTH transcriptional regulator